MRINRRGFIGAVAAVAALSRVVLPRRRKPTTILSVERSGGFVPLAEVDAIDVTTAGNNTRQYVADLRRVWPAFQEIPVTWIGKNNA